MGEKLLAGTDRHELKGELMKPGHKLLILGGDLHQSVELPAHFFVAGPQLLDLALYQGDGCSALVVDFQDFQYIRMVIEKVRVLAQVACDHFF